MKQYLGCILMALLVALTSCGGDKKSDNTEEETVGQSHSVLPGFAAGQVWKYDTREQEPNSTLTILKIETIDETEYLHIAINGLKMINPRAPGGFSNAIGHLPYSREKLLASVTELVTTLDTIPALGKGYDAWKEALDNGQAGPFEFTVKDAVEFVEVTMKD